jgi:putative FmdB family regulatory protein
MPLYEYRCASCGNEFEELVSLSAKSAPPCPSCGAKKPTRLYSTFSTEWYPSNVSWHNIPSKHDMGGAPDTLSSALIPKSISDGKKKAKGKGKGKDKG